MLVTVQVKEYQKSLGLSGTKYALLFADILDVLCENGGTMKYN
jgi:hypothetical protein